MTFPLEFREQGRSAGKAHSGYSIDGYFPPLPSLGSFSFHVGHLQPILKESGRWDSSACRSHPEVSLGECEHGRAVLEVSALGEGAA